MNNISVVLVINDTRLKLAYYDLEVHRLTILSDIIDDGANVDVKISVVYDQRTVAHIVVVVILIVICFFFVTAILILYLYFRTEKEIKATSVSVSLCMFTGCYLLLLHVAFSSQPARNVALPSSLTCNLLAWSSVVRIPTSLILATLLVKMPRVPQFLKIPSPFLTTKDYSEIPCCSYISFYYWFPHSLC